MKKYSIQGHLMKHFIFYLLFAFLPLAAHGFESLGTARVPVGDEVLMYSFYFCDIEPDSNDWITNNLLELFQYITKTLERNTDFKVDWDIEHWYHRKDNTDLANTVKTAMLKKGANVCTTLFRSSLIINYRRWDDMYGFFQIPLLD